MSFIRHSHRDVEEDFEYTYRPPRSLHRDRPQRRESGNNQEEDEQTNTTDGTAKTRSLSLCPSTLAASQAWQQWRESLRDEPRSRSKSLFVGETAGADMDMDAVRLGLSPCDDSEDNEEERMTSLLDALSPQKTRLALRTLRPRWASAGNETTARKASPLSLRKGERTADAKRMGMSLQEPLHMEHQKEEEGGGEEEQVVRLIPLRALLNYNRDLSGVRLSRAARIRRDNPALPTSPTDRLEPSPQQRLRSRRAAELQITKKGEMVAQC